MHRPDDPNADEFGCVEIGGVTIMSAKPLGVAPLIMPDITPFQSPIDYSEITSRSQLREHEKKHGVRQCGELKTPQDFNIWKKS